MAGLHWSRGRVLAPRVLSRAYSREIRGDGAHSVRGSHGDKGDPSASDAGRDIYATDRPGEEAPRATSHQRMTASMVSGASNPGKFVRGHGGKCAVHGYGRRPPPDSENPTGTRPRGTPLPPTRPLPEERTFSLPSSSFNESTWVSPGVVPPLGGRSAALGEGLTGQKMERKKTALIMPGQGSQYVTMSHDLFQSFASARDVWRQTEEILASFAEGQAPVSEQGYPTDQGMRAAFEQQLRQGAQLEDEFATAANRRSILDLVFHGDQLELTRAENAKPAILACSLAFLRVLQREFNVDLVQEHVGWATGHGSGIYAALVAGGALSASDALRALRLRGLESMLCMARHPVLFPEGCGRPASVYETWGFSNAASGQGFSLLQPDAAEGDGTRGTGQGNGKPLWKGTQVSAVVVRPGKLQETLHEVDLVMDDVRACAVPGIASDEFVAVANINSQLQIVLAGTRVGVSYACDRLRFKGLGARAVNVPVSGPFHTSLASSAREAFEPLVDALPINDPHGPMRLVSSVDGSLLTSMSEIRHDLLTALDVPVRWLDAVHTLVQQGVQRFVCLGPGRAIAHQISKELANVERLTALAAAASSGHESTGTLPMPEPKFEVWSVSTAHDVEQLARALSLVPSRGI
ncbi:[acyl-carrier-protein] S-malonyltransferase [Malassezia sp. CBS 17886]|nr:[acyl-carrier-protein] S-malonyltransferase [Malassezia sp. CBS 17886]